MSQKCLTCSDGSYCPGGDQGNMACPYPFSNSPDGATSIDECYWNVEPGYFVEVYDNDPDNFDAYVWPCLDGYYCPGNVKLTVDDAFNWNEIMDDQVVIECPYPTTSNEGASSISQCCSSDGSLCGGNTFRINFQYSTDKITRVIPSLYYNMWYYEEVFGVEYLVHPIEGATASPISMFPIPEYKSDSGIQFMGWYTAPDGGGKQVVGPTGEPMPSTSLFTSDTTLYAYEKTHEQCQSGRYYNGSGFDYCPENYYCPGTGETPIGTPGCRVACPAGMESDSYSDEPEDCHVPCGEHYQWESWQHKCEGKRYEIYFWNETGQYSVTTNLGTRVSFFEKYGTGFFKSDYADVDRTQMPVPTFSIIGWYTEPNCGGVRVSGAWDATNQVNGAASPILVTPDFFKQDTTLYACAMQRCTIESDGISNLKTGTGLNIPLYKKKTASVSIAVKYGENICYAPLIDGHETDAININKDGKIYHAENYQ